MKKKALIVDDEPDVVSFLQKLLDMWNYEVSVSTNGLDCLELVDLKKPDIILLDIMMPGLDGMSVCSEVSINYNIPIIIISGGSDPNYRQDSGVFGAFAYLPKPIDIDELKINMENALKSANNTSKVSK